MPLSVQDVEALAPDQASLKAASKLTTIGKWPLLGENQNAGLIWGECQGSGSNPYRVTVHENDHGYKCTCPSRKFPCKHALALMWIRAEGKGAFGEGDVPAWVSEWMGRRRSGTPAVNSDAKANTTKSIDGAAKDEPEKVETPEQIARKKKAVETRAAQKRAGLMDATRDLEQWIADQTRMGLGTFIDDVTTRCRAIAARLVDYKAQALASRVDEIPAQIMALPLEDKTEAAIAELGKLVLLVRSWQANPENPELMRQIANSETREQVLADPQGRIVEGIWEVQNERITTRRDGLVSHGTWLCLVDSKRTDFALLLDFYPAATGKRGRSFFSGDRFHAKIKFYPGPTELRGLIAERGERLNDDVIMEGDTSLNDPLVPYRDLQNRAPWVQSFPLTFGASSLLRFDSGRTWLRQGDVMLPVVNDMDDVFLGCDIHSATGLWNGTRLDLLSARTSLGFAEFDA